MATETLAPNGDDSGWPTGTFADIDEGVPGDAVAVMSTTTDDDVLILDLAATGRSDADTITQVDVKVHGRTTGAGGKDTFTVDWLIGGAVQGTAAVTGNLTGSHATYTLNDVGWNTDWTQAQLNGAQVQIQATQTGKAEAATWEVDSVDVVITYTPSTSGHPRAGVHHMKQMAGA